MDHDSTAIPSFELEEIGEFRPRRPWYVSWLLFLLRRLLLLTPPAALMALFIVTGSRGINFGYHWDEPFQADASRQMIEKGVLLTRPYTYPGVGMMLVLVPAVGDGITAFRNAPKGDVLEALRKAQTAMVATIKSPVYILQGRLVFLVVSALGILWIYLAGLTLTGRVWQATLAAALYGLSWEIAYHARWMVNDCLLAQFSALCLLFLVLHYRRRKTGWLWWAAIAAGLATGTKYQGVLLLGPVILAAFLQIPATVKQRIGRVIIVCAISFATYLVTTPGTFLDPLYFVDGLAPLLKHYSEGHFGYTVQAGLPHLRLLYIYLAYDLFSPYTQVSFVIFALAVVGAVVLCRSERRLAVSLVTFPVLFAIFFCWRYQIFVARNFLLLAPFLALFSARGFAEVLTRFRWPWVRVALVIGMITVMIVNARWLISAGESIRNRNDFKAATDAVAYCRDHPNTKFLISPRVTMMSQGNGEQLPPNAVTKDPDEVVFFAIAEGGPLEKWLGNDHWLTRATFGPKEVNLHYYSTWVASDRVVIMKLGKARRCHVPLAVNATVTK